MRKGLFMIKKLQNLRYKVLTYHFVFSELMKRDFKTKYKRSVLGILWSMLAPLFTLLVMDFVFGSFFGRGAAHYTIYLFTGIVVMTYYSQATNSGMGALVNNASIFSKVNVPKYLFLFSNIASSSINFGLTLILYFIFVIGDGLSIHWNYILLIFPLFCLILTVIGVSMILSALFVFFKDIQYLYGVFMTALNYCTPIFYTPDILGDMAYIFYVNPLFLFMNYIREIVIYSRIPSLEYHVACFVYSLVLLLMGFFVYKKYNYKFLYYV